jgi:hypothetical protein
VWAYTSTSPYAFIVQCLIKHRDSLTFYYCFHLLMKLTKCVLELFGYTEMVIKKRQSHPCNSPWKHIGLWDEAPTFSRQSTHEWWGGCCQLTRQPAPLYPLEDYWYSFVLDAELTPGP